MPFISDYSSNKNQQKKSENMMLEVLHNLVVLLILMKYFLEGLNKKIVRKL
jgi:hypothetical protein